MNFGFKIKIKILYSFSGICARDFPPDSVIDREITVRIFCSVYANDSDESFKQHRVLLVSFSLVAFYDPFWYR